MTYNAIVEDRPNHGGFIASILGWPGFTAEGRTREEALTRLRQTLLDRLPKVEIVPIEIDAPKSTHPWERFAGMFQDDPLFDQVLEDVETYRRELDAEPAE